MRGGGLTESEPNLRKNLVESLSTKNRTSTRILESFSKKKLFRVLTHPNEICKTETSNHSVIAGLTRNRRVAAGEGFTLAEVLITLGIIGIVAAMTVPTLVENYQKRVVETRLEKFYSTINQAVRMAEVEYGDKKIWFEDLRGANIDDTGKPIAGSSNAEKWFNKYLAPHLKIVKTELLSDGTFIVYFPDGSAIRQFQLGTTRDWLFYPNRADKCMEKFGINADGNWASVGKCSFAFNFMPTANNSLWKYHYNKGFEPWKYAWNGKRESLYNNCKRTTSTNESCAALIQYDGWKIGSDYPQKLYY